MKFFIVIAALVAASNCAPMSTLNGLLSTKNLVPAHLDAIQSKSSDVSAILAQLKAVLDDPTSLAATYSNYIAAYNKQEDDDRSATFADNLMNIAEHNVKYHAGEKTWFKGVNHFSDLTAQEFMSRFSNMEIPDTPTLRSVETPTVFSISVQDQYDDEAKDWRRDGIVTSVKNQGQCGSCVTFATNSVVESAMITKKRGLKIDLSEQELVDCTKENNGCSGGWYDASFNYIQKNGLSNEKNYAYTASDETCKASKAARAIKRNVLKWKNANPNGDENSLKDIILNQGPAAVAVAVNQEFQHYHGGIFSNECGSQINHAVVVVGYGIEDSDGVGDSANISASGDGEKYWIIKNSWGTDWGVFGYMSLIRGKSNHCQVASYAYTATA